jgi:hypothetical protein
MAARARVIDFPEDIDANSIAGRVVVPNRLRCCEITTKLETAARRTGYLHGLDNKKILVLLLNMVYEITSAWCCGANRAFAGRLRSRQL